MGATDIAAGLRQAGRVALDLLLPPHCLTCDAVVDAPGRFCVSCFRHTNFVTAPCCDRCGLPFAHAAEGGAHGLCAACLRHPPPWRRARAALLYLSLIHI